MIPGQGTFRLRRHWFFGRSNDLDSRTSNLGGDVQILACTVYCFIAMPTFFVMIEKKRRTLFMWAYETSDCN